MSFVSRSNTPRSQKVFSESRPSDQPRSIGKPDFSYSTLDVINDRKIRALRRANSTLEILPSWWSFCEPPYQANASLGIWTDLADLVRKGHTPDEVALDYFSTCVRRKYCGICEDRCTFGYVARYDPYPVSNIYGSVRLIWQPFLATPYPSRGFSIPIFLAYLQQADLMDWYVLTDMFERLHTFLLWPGIHSRRMLGIVEIPFPGHLARATGRKIGESHTNEQPSYHEPEDYRRQQALVCKFRTSRVIRNNYKAQELSARLLRDQAVNGTTLEIISKHEHNIVYPISPENEAEWGTTHGQSSLKAWRRAAGKNKSWKRCPKSAVPRQMHHKGPKRNTDGFEHQFSKSPLWIPAAFLRSQGKRKSPRLSGVVRRQVSIPLPERARHYNPDLDDAPLALHGRHHTSVTAQNTETRDSGPIAVEHASTEPASAFIRFTWKGHILTNGTGQLDRFLPVGLTFRNGWSITSFLRNESFADVYALSKASLAASPAKTGISWEAHVFLDEYHGNCSVFAARHKVRMQQSGACLDSFRYGGRHVFIMRIPSKPVRFDLEKAKKQFPVLVDLNKCNEQFAMTRRWFRGKPSFAAVAGGSWLDVDFDHRAPPVSEGRSALERELEQIEKARVKKAEKQRVKRRLQREKRIAEKLQKIEERVEEETVPVKVINGMEPHTHIVHSQLCQSIEA